MPSPGTKPHESTARDRAVHALLRLHHPSAPRRSLTAQQAVDAALQPPCLSPADAALCTELVYGSLRHEIRLQWLLQHYLRDPGKLPPQARMILLIATYELLYLDRIPAHATVNWAVGAVRAALGTGLSRLANAVLRTVDRLGDSARQDAWYADQLDDPLERLSIVHSIPIWIARLWIVAYGDSTAEEFALASARTPWSSVRINTARTGWETTRTALLRGNAAPVGMSGIAFPPGQQPMELSALWRTGELSWQGAGTQRMLQELQAEAWEAPIWDACAGRGGKTCAMLEMGLEVRLASDPHGARLAGMRQELDRLELPHLELMQGEAQHLEPGFTPQTILLDVPCSGLGTLARRPDTRLYRTEAQVEELVSLQREIIAATWKHLPPGGRLAYVTCTANPAENEQQAAQLLTLPDARLEREIPVRSNEDGADMMYGALICKANC